MLSLGIKGRVSFYIMPVEGAKTLRLALIQPSHVKYCHHFATACRLHVKRFIFLYHRNNSNQLFVGTFTKLISLDVHDLLILNLLELSVMIYCPDLKSNGF